MGGGPTTEILRPLLELAWAVAKAGTQAEPPIPPPAGLQPLMPLTDLTGRDLTTIREVVEENAEFRAKVARWARQAAVDRDLLRWLEHAGPGQRELQSMTLVTETVGPDRLDEKKEEGDGRGFFGPGGWVKAPEDAELARLRQMNTRLTDELTIEREARRQIERQMHADGEDVALARQSADQDRARWQDTVGALERRVSSFGADLESSAERLAQACQERDRALAELAELAKQLQEARAEAARLEANRESAALARQTEDQETAGWQARGRRWTAAYRRSRSK